VLLTPHFYLEIPYIHLQELVEDPNERELQRVLSLPPYKAKNY